MGLAVCFWLPLGYGGLEIYFCLHLLARMPSVLLAASSSAELVLLGFLARCAFTAQKGSWKDYCGLLAPR